MCIFPLAPDSILIELDKYSNLLILCVRYDIMWQNIGQKIKVCYHITEIEFLFFQTGIENLKESKTSMSHRGMSDMVAA